MLYCQHYCLQRPKEMQQTNNKKASTDFLCSFYFLVVEEAVAVTANVACLLKYDKNCTLCRNTKKCWVCV